MDPESFFHVAVKADDVDASEAFYCDHFDAEVVERGDADGHRPSGRRGNLGDADDGEGATAVTHVALDVADKLVYLFDEAPYEAAGLVDSVPTGFLHFGYAVSDVEAAHGELTDAGVEFLMEPTAFGGLKIAFLTDPSGVRIELIEHL